jgi:two-component sensor histidine kinase
VSVVVLPRIPLLVVDDRAENRAALQAILSGPYQVTEAESGDEALRRLIDHEFAALLVDIVMPEMNGFELAELVRKRSRTASVPILFITAAATDSEHVFRGYRAGAVDYLVKPLDPEIVRAKVSVFADLFRQRKQLEASLREKEVLLREVHHRVKNNLQVITSLLHLQASTQAPPIRALLAESEARIRSIALVHENLYQAETLESIDVDHYFAALVSALVSTFDTGRVEVSVSRTGVHLPIDNAISCGLIVNELVSNALKHAFPGGRHGSVVVALRRPFPDVLVLEVRDDGCGLPDSMDIRNATSMGLRLVQSLTHQLEGTIEIDRANGTAICIRFPSKLAH